MSNYDVIKQELELIQSQLQVFGAYLYNNPDIDSGLKKESESMYLFILQQFHEIINRLKL